MKYLKQDESSTAQFLLNSGSILQNYIIQFSTQMLFQKLQSLLIPYKRYILLTISVLTILIHAMLILSYPFLRKQHPLFAAFKSNSKHIIQTNSSSQLQWIIYSAFIVSLLVISNFFAISPVGKQSKWTQFIMLISSILLFVSCWILFMSMNTVIQTAQKLTLPEFFSICSFLGLEIKGDSFQFMKHMKIVMILGLIVDIIASCYILAFWKQKFGTFLKENFQRKTQIRRNRANNLLHGEHTQN